MEEPVTETTEAAEAAVHLDSTAFALLREWFTWWEGADEAPAKLPEALQVRTGLALKEIERFGHGDSERALRALREALADLWSRISQPDIAALEPSTIMLAQGNHRLLGYKERSGDGRAVEGRP